MHQPIDIGIDNHGSLRQLPWKSAQEAGISLVEVLVGLTVFAIASAATLAVFSGSIRSIYRTEDQARANAAIDSDISRLKQLAEVYNSCSSPASGAVALSGSTTPCTGTWPDGLTAIRLGDSYFYYPDPANSTAVTNFTTACASSSAASHITKNLIDYINDPAKFSVMPAESKVTRSQAVRESGTFASNHIILIDYTSSSFNINRRIKLLPVVSAWCP
jgi:type II secretory pathway pseudopilin PulG